MISSEVQRTLVKSPPELWAELSDPETLARHLGELGEIRITRVVPEQKVEWEAENTTGAVQIKASGWGTKVTLTVNHELPKTEVAADSSPEPPVKPKPEPEPIAAQAGPAPDPIAAEASPIVAEPERAPEPIAPGGAPEAEPTTTVTPPKTGIAADAEPLPDAEPQPGAKLRRGFFFGLFRRRIEQETVEEEMATEAAVGEITVREATVGDFKGEVGNTMATAVPIAETPPAAPSPTQPTADAGATQPAVEPLQAIAMAIAKLAATPSEAPAAPEALDASQAPETPQASETTQAPETPEASRPSEPEQTADLSAELKAAEEVAAEEVTAVLTSVLDRLGAAHHRPFSRA